MKAQESTLDMLYAVWLAGGSSGTKWLECGAAEESVRRRLVMRPFTDMEDQRLSNLLAALRRMECGAIQGDRCQRAIVEADAVEVCNLPGACGR